MECVRSLVTPVALFNYELLKGRDPPLLIEFTSMN
jgi:hypothetical protein